MKLSSEISAIVTGGASGLGEATAKELAAAGVKVGIFDMNEERGKMVAGEIGGTFAKVNVCLLYTSPSPRDRQKSRMPSSA